MAELNLVEGLELLDRRTRIVRLDLQAYLVISVPQMLVVIGSATGAIDFEASSLEPFTFAAALVAVFYSITFIVTAILVAMWIYRAHANLRAAEQPDLQFSPGWAIGWYFVPFANLFKPFQAMRELWANSLNHNDSFGQEADWRLKSWWGGWIVGNLLNSMSSRIRVLGGEAVAIPLDVATFGALGIAAWYLLKIIETVNAAQRSGTTMAHAFA
jgi:hypothetical protein